MFRRFMIVCWVLFAICGGTALVADRAYDNAEQEILSFKLGFTDANVGAPRVRKDIARFLIALDEHSKNNYNPFTALKPAHEPNWSKNKKIRDEAMMLAEIMNLIDPLGPAVSIGDEVSEADILKSFDESALGLIKTGQLAKRQAVLRDITFPAGLLAAILLVWNIIWHVSHWVWMGRKTT
jgi:hypothetical protein